MSHNPPEPLDPRELTHLVEAELQELARAHALIDDLAAALNDLLTYVTNPDPTRVERARAAIAKAGR